jgi:hypothetical protein
MHNIIYEYNKAKTTYNLEWREYNLGRRGICLLVFATLLD